MEAGDCIFIPIGWYHHVRSVHRLRLPAASVRAAGCVCVVCCVFSVVFPTALVNCFSVSAARTTGILRSTSGLIGTRSSIRAT